MANVTILGAGLMGTAVAWPLADNGHDVRLVGTHLDGAIIRSCLDRGWHPKLKRQLPDGIMPYYVEELPKALERADLVVSGVNSLGVRWIAHTLGPLLWPGARVLAVTKGLEADSNGGLRILPDLFHDELPAAIRDRISLNAIGGPCIAGELAGRRHTSVVFTGRDAEILQQLREIFHTKYYHIWTSADMVGVEACAAMKNAYTLAVGMATGLLDLEGGPDDAGASMHNVAAALFGASANEMTRIVGLLGGGIDNVSWLPGVGDQYVTCVGGRTIRMGRLLGAGLTYTEAVLQMAGETLEGVYVVKQMAQVLPQWEREGKIGSVLLAVSFVTFVALTWTPGDAAQALAGESASIEQLDELRAELGLDRPFLTRYLAFLSGAVHGDLGSSLVSHRNVAGLIAERLPYTVGLAILAILIASLAGTGVGMIAAARAGSAFDTLVMGASLAGLAIPSFWLALMLTLLFSLKLHWLPVVGASGPKSWVLPVITLALPTTAMVARLVRSGMVGVLHSEYIRTAHAKGIPGRQVYLRHALRNSLVPLLSVLGLHLGHLLGGAFVIETLFGWPGLGRLAVQAIFDRDTPVVLGCSLAIATMYLVVNLMVDVSHAWLDPRVAQEAI